MIPLTATEDAVMRDAATIATALIAFVLTPRDSASSSGSESMFSLHERMIIGMIEISMGGKSIFTSSLPAPAREPIRKYVMAGSSFSGSATSFMKLVPDWNIELIIMPPRTSPSI